MFNCACVYEFRKIHIRGARRFYFVGALLFPDNGQTHMGGGGALLFPDYGQTHMGGGGGGGGGRFY